MLVWTACRRGGRLIWRAMRHIDSRSWIHRMKECSDDCLTACRQGWPPDLEGDAASWQQELDARVADAKALEEEHRKEVRMMDGSLQLQLMGEEVVPPA